MADPNCDCSQVLTSECGETWMDACEYKEFAERVNAFLAGFDGEGLYKDFIEGGGPTTQKYEDALNACCSSVSTAKKQITYNLCQVAAKRVKCQKDGSGGGSMFSEHWWKRNVWGQTPFQNILYVLSLIVVLYITATVLINLVFGDRDSNIFEAIAPALTRTTGSSLVPLAITVIGFLVFSTIAINYTTARPGETEKETIEKRKRGTKIMVSIAMFLIVLTLAFNLFLDSAGNGSNQDSVLHIITNIISVITFSLFVVFSVATSAYVPQMVLIGLLLQRFFFTPWTFEDIFTVIPKVGAFVLLLAILLGYYANLSSGYSLIFARMFLFFLLATFGQSAFMAFIGQFDEGKTSGWSLLMMPLFYFIISLFKGGVDFKDIMVQNSNVFISS